MKFFVIFFPAFFLYASLIHAAENLPEAVLEANDVTDGLQEVTKLFRGAVDGVEGDETGEDGKRDDSGKRRASYRRYAAMTMVNKWRATSYAETIDVKILSEFLYLSFNLGNNNNKL